MSRTRRNNKIDLKAEPPGFGFEIGNCVCNVYLKKLVYGEKGDVKYLRLSFLKDNKWINKYIRFEPKQNFEDEESYKKHKITVQESLENLMSVYLSKENILYVIKRSKGLDFKGYIKSIIYELKDKKYWEKPICIKVIPEDDGGRTVGKYPPFMNKMENKNFILKYSFYELNKYSKNFKK